MKKYLISFVLLFILFISGVKAETEYYDFVWDYDWVEDHDISGIIDAVDTDNGFIAVGFAGEDPVQYAVMFFNKDGSYNKMITYEYTKLVKVLEDNGKYYAFGINEVLNGYVIIELDSKGSVIKTLEIPVLNEVHIEEDDAFYVSVVDNQFYIFDFWYYSVYYSTIKVEKDLSSYTELKQSNWDDEIVAAVDDYYNLHVFYQTYIFDGTPKNYEVTDSIPYKDGFLVSNVDWDDEISYIYYEKDGVQIWKTTLDGVFVKSIIPYEVENVILISQNEWGSNEESIGVYDTNGKKLVDDDLANYYPEISDTEDYVPEFFIELNNGFMIASSKYGEGFATRLMYFARIYDIIPKVEGKGTIEVINTSAPYKSVTFKVTPEEGYVLSVVKVTDSDGNTLVFTEDTFTMPGADVTIEAVFVPKNPNTSDIGMIALIFISMLVVVVTYINYRKLKWLS